MYFFANRTNQTEILMAGKVSSLKTLKISDNTESVQSDNACGSSIRGGRDVCPQQSGQSQDCVTTNIEQSCNKNCSASQTADKNDVSSLKQLKISDNTESVQSENACGSSIRGGRDVCPQQSGQSQDCVTTNIEQSCNKNCSASQTADKYHVSSLKQLKISDNTESVHSENACGSSIRGGRDVCPQQSGQSQDCVTTNIEQSCNKNCSASQTADKNDVSSLKQLKISDNTESVQSENACGSSIRGCRDVCPQQSGQSQDCVTTNIEQSCNKNCSASQTADKNDVVKKCVSAQEKILRNWKNLKEAFSHITPGKLLDILSEHKLVSVEHIPDVNKMSKSLALDCILIACTKKVFNQVTFEKFAMVTGEINKTKKIIWEPLVEHRGQLKDYKIDDEHKTRLKQILKMEHIIKIKDEFLQQLIFTFEDQEQIVQDLLKNRKSEHFFKTIFEEENISKGSITCLVKCLCGLCELQGYGGIKSFLKDLKESHRQHESTGDSKEIDCIPTEESEVHESSKSGESVKIKVKIDHNGDKTNIDNALKQGVLNAIKDYTKRQGIVVGKIQSGCLEIYLSSIHGNVRKQITNILTDGAYLNLLKKIINVEEMKKLLCPGKYKLMTRIISIQRTSQSNLNKDAEVVKHLISANWSFLVEEIDAERLLDVFNSEGIQLPGITELKGDCREQAEHFLKAIETNGLEDKLFEVLKMKQMTYIYERLQTFKNVYAYSDISSLRKQIKKQFLTLITAVDLDDVRPIFEERNIFETVLFETIQNNFEDSRELGMAQFLVEILKSGPLAMLTLVDSLYVCHMNELANILLTPTEDIIENDEEKVEISSDQKTEGEECFFEGTYELIVRETDKEETCGIVTPTVDLSLTTTLSGEMYTLETVPPNEEIGMELSSTPTKIGELEQSTKNIKNSEGHFNWTDEHKMYVEIPKHYHVKHGEGIGDFRFRDKDMSKEHEDDELNSYDDSSSDDKHTWILEFQKQLGLLQQEVIAKEREKKMKLYEINEGQSFKTLQDENKKKVLKQSLAERLNTSQESSVTSPADSFGNKEMTFTFQKAFEILGDSHMYPEDHKQKSRKMETQIHDKMTKGIQKLNVPRSFREQMISELENWKKDDQMFVDTRAACHVLHCIKTNSCVTITGSSGVGKTFTVRHVALQMAAEGFDILPVTNPEDLVKYHYHHKKTLFVIDDLCGTYRLNQTYLDKWKAVHEDIKKLLELETTKIIASCRLQVFQDERFKLLPIFTACECNLLSQNKSLSKKEKKLIAEHYLKSDASKIGQYIDLFDFFPLLCRLYNENQTLNVVDFFKNPFTVYEKEMNRLSTEESYGKYCALALCVMFNNQLKEEWLTDNVNQDIQQIIENTCEACRLNMTRPRQMLINDLDSLINKFLTKEQGCYHTIHDKLFDYLIFYFGNTHMMECLIKNVDSQIISERFVFERKDDSDQFIVIVPDSYHKMYIERMFDDWFRGEVVMVFTNNNMKSPTFRNTFLMYLKKLDITYQKHLVTICDNAVYPGHVLVQEYYVTSFRACNSKMETPLQHCCALGDINMVEWCCSCGADVNCCCVGESPLYIACKGGYTDIVTKLVDNKADIHMCTWERESPLSIASQRGFTDIVTLLKINKDINKDLYS